jgi:hypothetical protein
MIVTVEEALQFITKWVNEETTIKAQFQCDWLVITAPTKVAIDLQSESLILVQPAGGLVWSEIPLREVQRYSFNTPLDASTTEEKSKLEDLGLNLGLHLRLTNGTVLSLFEIDPLHTGGT